MSITSFKPHTFTSPARASERELNGKKFGLKDARHRFGFARELGVNRVP